MTELEYFKGDELAASTWRNKYAAEGELNPNDTHRRLAKEFARIENNYDWDIPNVSAMRLSTMVIKDLILMKKLSISYSRTSSTLYPRVQLCLVVVLEH